MSPGEKAGAVTVELARLARADVEAARAQVAAVSEHVAADAVESPSPPVLAFASVGVDRAYSALEAAFVRIARAVEAAAADLESFLSFSNGEGAGPT